jgi:IS5 family transposase
LFRETLTNQGAIKKLFEMFDRYLNEAGYQAKKGMMIDATFVEVPRQRNSREENATIKNGEVPEDWKSDTSKLRQKDSDARWTKKNDDDHYGYKNHVNADVKSKLIRDYEVTPANTHDSAVFEEILDPFNSNQSVYADSAYFSKEHEEKLEQLHYNSKICRKGNRGKPLSKFQDIQNHKKSRIRVRVEHIFGFMKNSMRAGIIRCIGLKRAKAKIGIINLVYNMSRYVQLLRYA